MSKQLVITKIFDISGAKSYCKTLYIAGVITTKKKCLFITRTTTKEVILTCSYYPLDGSIYSVYDTESGEFLGDKFKPTILRYLHLNF